MGVSPGFGLGLADHPLNPLQALLGADELRAEMGGTEGHGKAPPCTQAPPPKPGSIPGGSRAAKSSAASNTPAPSPVASSHPSTLAAWGQPGCRVPPPPAQAG